ncbi:MAG: choice-of-anchor D domain-containing protein [Burkholderiales bacterium]
MRRLLFLVAAFALPIGAVAQDATAGGVLYTSAIVSGKQSCGNGACHGGLPGNPQNQIAKGLDASKIRAALGSKSQMNFLQGKLSDAQLNDLAAYVAGVLGGSPSYLAVAPVPKPTLSPASLSFPSQSIGTVSNVQTVTLANAASATGPLVVGTVTTSAGSDFAVAGGTCAAAMSLAAGASCTVALTFTPTVSGTRSGTLTVSHNGAGGASNVSLSGAGGDTSPTLTLSPTQLSFSQTVGTSSDTQRVVVGNTGRANLVFSAITLTGANASEFSLAEGAGCSISTPVPSGSNCAIDIRFTPSDSGARTASLLLQHNAGAGSSTVTLSGQGNAGATAGLALDATLIDLGTQALGIAGPPRTLTVSNNGQANLQFTTISVSGANAAEIVRGGSCAAGTAVPPGGACTVTLALKPTALGTRSASLDIASNAPVGTASVTLTGEAVPTPAPFITLSQASVGFGRVTIGTTAVARTVQLSNSGGAALAIASIQSSSSELTTTHDCPASLAGGAACTISTTYAPKSATAAESIVITSNAFSSPNSIVVTGQGSTTPLPVLVWGSASPTALPFGSVDVGSTATGTALTLLNNGPGAITVSDFGLAGANADAFSVGGGSCLGGVTLAAGASCTVVVTFVPNAAGPRSASLIVASSGSNPPDVALSGVGAISTNTGGGAGGVGSGGTGGGTGGGAAAGGSGPTPFTADQAMVDFRSLLVQTGGRSAPLSVRISNAGAVTATITGVTATGGFVVQAAASSTDACQGVPWTLPPGASCTVSVLFAPSAGGAATGTLSIQSANAAALDVPLTAQATTTMTNTGGGGGVSLLWLALLALAVPALWRCRPANPIPQPKEST